ncbi:hypothetical protein CEE69_15270 [Rhodopirellula bahusiensis]|uniref:Uncharacterized protein n=2 Tax=Rhodopirellula bahusiensis TaxID=2014065 RepID=A0A2G1W5S4_9BACT|nr:hypothetical protein CEE69_15270 [Rhodopirellula bahusiensis]
MSRKVSKDFNSTGFSINLEGEIGAPVNDPEFVIEEIKKYYDVAEESLRVQIGRYQEEGVIEARPATNGHQSSRQQAPPQKKTTPSPDGTGHVNRINGNAAHADEPFHPPATNKQIQFLLTLGKREGLTKPQLEQKAKTIIGRDTDLYDMTRREAGSVIDQFMPANSKNSR